MLSIRKKMPLYIIIAVVLMAVAMISVNGVEFVEVIYKDGHGHSGLNYYNQNSGVGVLLYFFLIIVAILPFFGMNYRYSLARSDTFRQAPFKERTIRYGEHLSTLVITLIAYTVAYWFFVLLLANKNYGNIYVPEDTALIAYRVIYYNYIWFVPLYFASLGLGVGQYFISYFLVSRSNNFLNSLITFNAGQMFLGFFYIIIDEFISQNGSWVWGYNPLTCGSSMFFAPTYLYLQFNELIVQGTNYYEKFFVNSTSGIDLAAFVLILSGATFVLLSSFSIFMFLQEKDPSSEWAGKPDSNTLYQEIIYHAGYGAFGSLIMMVLYQGTPLFITIFFYYVIFTAAYYTFYGLLHRNFKLKGYQFLILAAVVALTFIIGVSYHVVYEQYQQQIIAYEINY